MIYRGPGFLAVVWFGSLPTPYLPSPVSMLSLFLSLPVSRGSSLRESLVLFKSFNTLSLTLTGALIIFLELFSDKRFRLKSLYPLLGYGLHFFLIFASFARSSMTGRSVNTYNIRLTRTFPGEWKKLKKTLVYGYGAYDVHCPCPLGKLSDQRLNKFHAVLIWYHVSTLSKMR